MLDAGLQASLQCQKSGANFSAQQTLLAAAAPRLVHVRWLALHQLYMATTMIVPGCAWHFFHANTQMHNPLPHVGGITQADPSQWHIPQPASVH